MSLLNLGHITYILSFCKKKNLKSIQNSVFQRFNQLTNTASSWKQVPSYSTNNNNIVDWDRNLNIGSWRVWREKIFPIGTAPAAIGRKKAKEGKKNMKSSTWTQGKQINKSGLFVVCHMSHLFFRIYFPLFFLRSNIIVIEADGIEAGTTKSGSDWSSSTRTEGLFFPRIP